MDVRPSDIEALDPKVRRRNYGKYLPSLRLTKVRSFTNQIITFDFPVTAIIGTNGGGKSTILGAAAIAYKQGKPGDFFPKSNIGDTSMADWRIDYDIIDKTLNKNNFKGMRVSFQRNGDATNFWSATWLSFRYREPFPRNYPGPIPVVSVGLAGSRIC